MLTKKFTEITNPKTWDLSKTEDIILTQKGSSEKRVVINFKRYEELKKSINLLLQQITLNSELEDDIDWDLHIEDFKNILKNDNFTEITDDHYFERLVRKIKSKDNSKN